MLSQEQMLTSYPSVRQSALPTTQPAMRASRSLENAGKRGLDVSVALMALLMLAPLLLIIAALIWAGDRQNPIFRQNRTGRDGRTFRIYKFRSMRVLEDGAVVTQAKADDQRVTPLGRVLRRTSIDELPQLINVLRGDMSLVGPRPHALAHDDFYGREVSGYHERFAVRPGLTGWAQVNGSRGETPTVAHMSRRIDLDLWYIENQNLALDLTILAKTAWTEISRKTNAY